MAALLLCSVLFQQWMGTQKEGGFTTVPLCTLMLFPEMAGFRKGSSQQEELQACHGTASYFFFIYSVSVIETHPAASQKHDRDWDYHQ